MKSLLVLIVLAVTSSVAHAREQIEYQKVDTFFVSRNLSTENKIELNLGGAKNGAVDEILGYFIKAKVPRAYVEGDLIFKGSKGFRISIDSLGINMLLQPLDYFSTSINESLLYKKENLGLASIVEFGGAQAKYIAGVMEQAGVQKVPFKGNPESFSLTGRLVKCSNSVGVMGYVCELTMPRDASKY